MVSSRILFFYLNFMEIKSNFFLKQKHMKYHNDSIAQTYSFYDILTLNETNRTTLNHMEKFRHRCLDPGNYVKHLNNWLRYFSFKQIYAVDGDELKYEPVDCLNKLQSFLPVQERINFRSVIKFDRKKNQFCTFYKRPLNRVKCLGSSKGRKYPALDMDSRLYL